MKKLICVLLCAAMFLSLSACSGPKTDESEKPDYTALSEKAQTIADTIVSDYGSTSVQYAIIDSGEIILSGSGGVYDKEENRAITRDDMYGIGSTSKMFVTAAAMMLVDQGLLDIDKPLTDYIPEFKMADERYKEITPRMLMNHSSGLYGTSYFNILLFDDPDTIAHDTLLELLSKQNLKYDPGELMVYCNDGFTLLEILVERISGISFTQFVAENFCKPLELTHTKTPQDDFDRALIVRNYSPLYDGALPGDTLLALGSGGLYSTAEELCRFSEVLMGNKPEILSEKSATMMRNDEYKKSIWQVDAVDDAGFFGLGWDTVHAYPFGDYGIESAAKSGGTQFFFSYLFVLPEYDIAMAVLSSGGNTSVNYGFAATVLQELLLQKGIIKQISPQRTFDTPVQVSMPEALSGYSGLYAGTSSQFDVLVKDGVLTIAGLAGSTEYVYVGDGAFKSEDDSSASFVELSNGNTYIQVGSCPTFSGVGQSSGYSLMAQRLTPATVPQEISDIWSTRAGMTYYLVNDKPTSQAYFTGPSTKLNDNFESGYAYAGAKIIDAVHAANTLTARDVSDLAFFTKDGAEYLDMSGSVYIREDAIQELTADTASCAIGADNYARYYRVGAYAAQKTMTVELPKDAAYAVYDENDVCVDFTTVTHNTTTVLPANGKVVFVGNAGDVFGIALQ